MNSKLILSQNNNMTEFYSYEYDYEIPYFRQIVDGGLYVLKHIDKKIVHIINPIIKYPEFSFVIIKKYIDENIIGKSKEEIENEICLLYSNRFNWSLSFCKKNLDYRECAGDLIRGYILDSIDKIESKFNNQRKELLNCL